MRQAFIEKNISPARLEIIRQANEIIETYQAQGFSLTLRQLYYQFVHRKIIPNKFQEYKRLGDILDDGRMAGLVDWDAIEDRTRNLVTHNHWGSPADIALAAAQGYQEDLWQGQMIRPEVWIEKDALTGVIEPICKELRVPYFACRGYNSQSEQYAAGRRFRMLARRGLTPIVLHLGDHDPSGVDMTRDLIDRLSVFAERPVDVRRLALNFNQVEEYDLPPDPAKTTDSRSTGYIDLYGEQSWELDALEPTVIAQLIRAALEEEMDLGTWNEKAEQEAHNRGILEQIADRWEDVETFILGEEE